jgi:dihydrodipicolinate synthase/N-acetylneuraminate lyase
MPAMAGSQWPIEVLRELAADGVVSGVKESGEEVGRFLQILDRCPPGFAAYCGTPTLLSLVTLAGGAGGILAIANAVPERCLAVYEAARAGEGRRAAELFAPLVPLLAAIRAAGPSPTGMRAAAAIRFGVGTATRRPLMPVADDGGIRAALAAGT